MQFKNLGIGQEDTQAHFSMVVLIFGIIISLFFILIYIIADYRRVMRAEQADRKRRMLAEQAELPIWYLEDAMRSAAKKKLTKLQGKTVAELLAERNEKVKKKSRKRPSTKVPDHSSAAKKHKTTKRTEHKLVLGADGRPIKLKKKDRAGSDLRNKQLTENGQSPVAVKKSHVEVTQDESNKAMMRKRRSSEGGLIPSSKGRATIKLPVVGPGHGGSARKGGSNVSKKGHSKMGGSLPHRSRISTKMPQGPQASTNRKGGEKNGSKAARKDKNLATCETLDSESRKAAMKK